MIITEWTDMMWAEWAEATTTLLRLPSDDQWSRIWNEALDKRINAVLRIYGVKLNLDDWAKELMNGFPESAGTNDLHRMQTEQAYRHADLQSLSSPTEGAGTQTRWGRLRAFIRSVFRSNRDRATTSEQGR